MALAMTTPTTARRFSLTDQANAHALILKNEFGVPFAFYRAVDGKRVATKDSDDITTRVAALDAAAVVQFAQQGQAAALLKATGCFRVRMVLFEAGVPVLVAVGELPALGRQISELAQEQVRLEKWLQAVMDRLRQADQFMGRHREDIGPEKPSKIAWESLLRLDHVARRLRIHKEPAKNQKRILQAALEVLGVEALVWVPPSADDTVVILGEGLLSPWDFRQLAVRFTQSPDLHSSGLLLCNQVQVSSLGARFPQIGNMLALPVCDQGSQGWVIALNKRDPTRPSSPDEMVKVAAPSRSPIPSPLLPFRRSDAALLTPFVALLDLHVRSSGRYRDLQDLLVGLARSLTAAIDAKDSYTYGHSERVARIAVELGRHLGLPEEELSDVFLAGLLHDIGKIGIRDSVLRKPGPLTPEEFEHVKQHVTIGYSILQSLRPISHLLPGVRNHHERYDGKGYPDNLAGEAIPLLARILAVADSFDAMTTHRPYRQALPIPEVEQIFADCAGTQWDGRVIAAYQACRQKIHGIRQRGVGESLRHALHDALRANDSNYLKSSVPAVQSCR
jgi:HD-GYP domain-containing protein (c-di-GMP phosphodiesterase class II)